MGDRLKVVIGLVLFVVVATFPIWSAFGVSSPPPPDLAKAREGSRCVESPAWMAANHAQLLDDWRQAVVRDGRRTYTASDDARHDMYLTRNCLNCHGGREGFCEKCHTYADVQVTCWNCHTDPRPEGHEQ